jgi:hypothetical protein
MRIVELRLSGNAGWPSREWLEITSGLNAVYGGAQSGKTTLSGLLSHLLYGQPPANALAANAGACPDGEVVVESAGRQYRLRRHHAGAGTARLTVSALDGSHVAEQTVRELVGQLSPAVLGFLCAPSFANTPDLSALLSSEFAATFQTIDGARAPAGSRRTAELALRRDQLAQELETRIAGERRASKELDGRWRELDRLVRDEQQQTSTCEAQLHALQAALAETDARLRYRRLELNTDLRWHADDCDDTDRLLAELDEQISRWRASIAELAQREAAVRARLATLQSEHGSIASTLAEQRAWLVVARQLSADLAGEISRLARASASQQCVCHDAHPRLRPIAETMQRQLEVLESLIIGHGSGLQAEALRGEVEQLSRAECELRRHVEQLLGRRQALVRQVRSAKTQAKNDEGDHTFVTAADVGQLEQRRMELEQERFQRVEQVRMHRRKLRDLKAKRDTVARQRAALLSARSIEHVQRELADVQRKLEQAINDATHHEEPMGSAEHPSRASDYLAQLSDGRLVRLALVDHGRRAQVTNAAGESLPTEALPAADRDLVYLSFCLALLSAAARRGVWLPLVLDDLFLRLDARAIASVAAVLEAFCRQGHQVILFTGQQTAKERLASLGVAVRDIASLRYRDTAVPTPAVTCALHDLPMHHAPQPDREEQSHRRKRVKRKAVASPQPRNGKAPETDRSDAA